MVEHIILNDIILNATKYMGGFDDFITAVSLDHPTTVTVQRLIFVGFQEPSREKTSDASEAGLFDGLDVEPR